MIWISYLLSLSRPPGTMLNRSGKTRHLCLVPNLRGKAFSFLPLSIMLAVGFSYMVYIMLRYKLSGGKAVLKSSSESFGKISVSQSLACGSY